VTDLWDEALKENDSVVYIPMSSGLSNSCQTAKMLAEDYDGKVQVVDNQRISVTMLQSIYDAETLIKAGWNAKQIKEKLEEEALNSSIFIMVDTLKYLKKGGRVTPAAAAIGTVLHIKPVLTIQGAKLDAFAKARGTKQAKKIMIDAIRSDMEGRFKWFVDKGEAVINYSWSEGDDPAEVEQWHKDLEEAFPGYEITGQPLSLVIGCHIGPGSLACTVSRKVVV
jgi:DegV family protein with EDD domain